MKEYTSDPQFPIGNVVITGAAARAMNGDTKILEWLLARHQSGDWGMVSDDDKLENDAAVRGWALKSAYRCEDGREFLVITEANRKITKVMLPEQEYEL